MSKIDTSPYTLDAPARRAKDMTTEYQPWKPTQNVKHLRVLGKLAEESAELGAALARCIIQGIEAAEPVTLKPNRQWLQEEIADVLCNVALVIECFDLDEEFMNDRINKKLPKLRGWQS